MKAYEYASKAIEKMTNMNDTEQFQYINDTIGDLKTLIWMEKKEEDYKEKVAGGLAVVGFYVNYLHALYSHDEDILNNTEERLNKLVNDINNVNNTLSTH